MMYSTIEQIEIKNDMVNIHCPSFSLTNTITIKTKDKVLIVI